MQGMTRALAPYAAAAMLGLVVAAAQSPTEAQGYGRYGSGPRYVVAESQFGNGTISGPIRPGPHGWQVRMPRGTWIDCVRSCSDTLRRATIDFWQTNGPNAPGSGRGYLTWEFSF
jgi:hypothetical protein